MLIESLKKVFAIGIFRKFSSEYFTLNKSNSRLKNSSKNKKILMAIDIGLFYQSYNGGSLCITVISYITHWLTSLQYFAIKCYFYDFDIWKETSHAKDQTCR